MKTKELRTSEYYICFKDDDSEHEKKFRKLFSEIQMEDNVSDSGHGYGEGDDEIPAVSEYHIDFKKGTHEKKFRKLFFETIKEDNILSFSYRSNING